MCGFCGIVDTRDASRLEADVRRMSKTLEHRGPDAEGVFVAAPVALGHRRLSIIDLSENGAQPMRLGPLAVAYNGEAYNFGELRDELQALGRRFRGHSDTEVVLHAYDQWGLDGLARLEGMFALALWDAARSRLVLVRDRLGIKPLYYSWTGGRLAFGSEIKAVLAAGAPHREMDAQAFSEYLWYGNAFEERTIYRGVRSLLPGHRLVLEEGALRTEPWWRLEQWMTARRDLTPSMAADEVRAAVDFAVRRQLVSDVPVGIFLSGGVDSSSIAASAAAAGARSLHSFSVGFDEPLVDELAKARGVAAKFGFQHHELEVRGAAIEEVVETLAHMHDEPFADAANIPLYLLARALDGAVKVVLQGDGGDEMFAGYRRYAILANSRWWSAWPRLLGDVLWRLPGEFARRLARMGDAAGNADAALRMALLLTLETLRDPPAALLRDSAAARLAANTDPFLSFRNCARRFAGEEPVQQMLLTDICLQLPSQFLPKVDRATMALGIEARVPLLDDRVASLAVGLPAALKVRGAGKKIVLRDAMRERLPASILDGPKTGFGVPYARWLRGPLREFARARILDAKFLERHEFDVQRVARAFDEHASGRRDRGFLVWKLLQLALWTRNEEEPR